MIPPLAVIGGSSAHTLLSEVWAAERIGCRRTPYGESQPIFRVRKGDMDFFFLPRHGDKGYSVAPSWINYRANIYALKELGVERIIAWSGPGAINPNYAIGQFVVPHDVLDETRLRKTTFFEGKGIGFIRQYPVFCPTIRAGLVKALGELSLKHSDGGIYVCTEGPRLETAAEIRKYAQLGADLVGMTLCPEVFLARELEMCYASLCYVTNYAEGIRSANFEPGRLFDGLATEEELKVMASAVARIPDILIHTVRVLAEQPRSCPCPRLMERYRKRGDVGPDWRTWFT